MDYQNVYNILSSDKAVCIAGFSAGFVYAFKLTEKTLKRPLQTLLCAAIDGAVCLFGASIVVRFLPDELKFMIPLTVAASCIYWKYQDFYGPKKPKKAGRTNNNIHD